MKKVFLSLLLLTACHTPDKPKDMHSDKIVVLSTIAMIGDLVKEVGKDHVINVNLIKGQLDPHSYELVKGDDEKFARADVIFANGLGLEHGYTLRHNLENNPHTVLLGDTLLNKYPEALVKIDDQYDPHVWMDIGLWAHMVDPIVQKLSELDPIHAKEYEENGLALKQKMLQVDQWAYDHLQSVASENRYLVTSHNAFNYFAKHYLKSSEEENWKNRLAAPEGLAPEAELSARDLIRVIDYVKEHHVFVLFAESNVNQEALRKIISAANEKGMMLHLAKKTLYVDSMGDKQSYLEMMEHNVKAIAGEMQGE